MPLESAESKQYGDALVTVGALEVLFKANPYYKDGDVIEKIEFYMPPKYRLMEIMFVAKHTNSDIYGQQYAVDAILDKNHQEVVWQGKVM